MMQVLSSADPDVQSSSISTLEPDHCLSSYDYELPTALIAQNPAVPRDTSRLLVVNSAQSEYQHSIFRHLPDFLSSGDLLVLNNTRVIPARMYGHKTSGATVEVLLLEEQQQDIWLSLVKPGKRLPVGAEIIFDLIPEVQSLSCEANLIQTTPNNQIFLRAKVIAHHEPTGGRILEFSTPEGLSVHQLLEKFGYLPLPPYITQSVADPEQYQTVYGINPGSVAAPTAGLHFTNELLHRLQEQGINQAFVTLNVGLGTFRPVEVTDITTHHIHHEWVEVPKETVTKIQETKAKGGRIIAVGTTVVRSLESAAVSGELQPFYGQTNLFIYPGYQWQVVEGMITNFHLPKSSLLMLVSALIGRERLMQLYQIAIAEQYRFYSFGDAMLIIGNRS